MVVSGDDGKASFCGQKISGISAEHLCITLHSLSVGSSTSAKQCTGNNLRIMHNYRREPVYTPVECLKYTKTQTGFLTHSSW